MNICESTAKIVWEERYPLRKLMVCCELKWIAVIVHGNNSHVGIRETTSKPSRSSRNSTAQDYRPLRFGGMQKKCVSLSESFLHRVLFH